MRKKLEIRKLLVVDDEPEICAALQRVLKMLNLSSDTAVDGKQALEMLKTNAYHAVISDIMMPAMTGLECLAQAQAAGIYVPFVFLTGYSDKERIAQATRLGAVDFISKPFDIDEVSEVIFRVLEIGVREERVRTEIQDSNPELFESIRKDQQFIALLRVMNNRKRTG